MVILCYAHIDLTLLDDVGLVFNIFYSLNECIIIALYVLLVVHKVFQVTWHDF